MYGMVNKAAEDYVCSYFGEQKWAEIREMARVEVAVFLEGETYPDAATQQIVAASAQVLDVPTENILEAFGEHWILKTAKEQYGPMLEACGQTLTEFFRNLPNFYSRIALVFPSAQLPRFSVAEARDGEVLLNYHAPRPDVQRFVVGLLRGAGKKFKTPVKIQITQEREPAGGLCDVLAIRWA